MRISSASATIGAIAIAVCFFFIGFVSHGSPGPKPRVTPTPPRPDGNPVGFHLHGQAQVKPQSFSLTQCDPNCTVLFDVSIGQNGNPPPATTSCTSMCFHFAGSNMVEYSNNTMTHPQETVSADGTMAITP